MTEGDVMIIVVTAVLTSLITSLLWLAIGEAVHRRRMMRGVEAMESIHRHGPGMVKAALGRDPVDVAFAETPNGTYYKPPF